MDESEAKDDPQPVEHRERRSSAWKDEVAARAHILRAGKAAVRAWEAEHGELTAEELARADSILDGVGSREIS